MGPRRVALDVPPDVPLVRADFTLMQQVLYNVLENAAKYSPETANVHVDVRRENSDAVLAVTDDGIGIAPGDLEKVFDKFYRVTGGDRQVAGTGLGLAICRGIVEAHGGTIKAFSPIADGHGTRIVIRLPLDPRPRMTINI
jgi:two-component system sensor histidine kinase KdpD